MYTFESDYFQYWIQKYLVCMRSGEQQIIGTRDDEDVLEEEFAVGTATFDIIQRMPGCSFFSRYYRCNNSLIESNG